MLEIKIILDRSGSMEVNKSATINGFNKFISDQKNNNIEDSSDCFVSFYQFNHRMETIYTNKPLNDVRELNNNDFHPDGYTALYDTMGRILRDDCNCNTNTDNNMKRIIMLVITDGEENSSNEFTKQSLKELIEQKKNFVDIVYIGSNQDAVLEGNALGTSNAITYTDNNTATLYSVLSCAVTRSRKANNSQLEFLPEERNSLMF